MELRGAKVLVMGLGTLGGGVATTKWLVKHGARVTVTDLRDRRTLAPALKALGSIAKHVRFALGGHRVRDFKAHELIVVNPAVPRESEFLKIAQRARRDVVNDARIFFNRAPNPIVAVTGTRGKTTTTNWIAHLLRENDPKVLAAGNTPERPLLLDLDRLARNPETTAVIELSSWQLEHLGEARRAPDIAVITNLYSDHLNRYRSMEDYARAKAAIFRNQNPSQALILNARNPWIGFFMRLAPRARRYFFSRATLPRSWQGLSVRSGAVVFVEGGAEEMILGKKFIRDFINTWGTHSLENLLAAMLAAHLAGAPWNMMPRRIRTLPPIPLRQEIVMRRKRLTVVNDSASTSPDATVAALRRFAGTGTFLITGGTDKKLELRALAAVMKALIAPACVFFLNGSATKKLLAELTRIGYFRKISPQIFENLSDILRVVKDRTKTNAYRSSTVLFSPGAASFEKFKNEFDRGRQFTREAWRVFGHA